MKRLFLKVNYRFLGSLIGGIMAIKNGKEQESSGKQKIAQSDKLMPLEEDPEQRLAYANIRKKADSYQSGSFASSMRDDLDNNYANINEGILSLASGGGADATALMRQGKTASQAYNALTGTLEQKGLALEQQANTQLGDLLQRELELKLMKHQEKRYDGQTELAAGLQNQNAGMASIGSAVDSVANIGIAALTGGIGGKSGSGAGGLAHSER